MPKSTPASQSRTKGESLLDLDFAIEISVLNQRFYERVNKAIALVSLVAGSAAFVTVFHPNSVVVTVAGLTVGFLALTEQVYDFRGKAATHSMLIRKFLKLKARSGGMTLERLDAAQATLALDTIPVVQGLRRVAYNNNVLRHGYSDFVRPLSRWQRLLVFLVGG
jgi:hypothetical protein